MSLDCIHFKRHRFAQRVQRHITLHGAEVSIRRTERQKKTKVRNQPNVIVSVGQKATQNIDGKNTKTHVRFNLNDGQAAFVENRIAHSTCSIGIGSNLKTFVSAKYREP